MKCYFPIGRCFFEQNQYSRAAFFRARRRGALVSTTARTAPWASSWRTLQEGLGPSATVGDDEVTRELGELGRWTMFEGFDMVNHGKC
jgi:hypothetical protein